MTLGHCYSEIDLLKSSNFLFVPQGIIKKTTEIKLDYLLFNSLTSGFIPKSADQQLLGIDTVKNLDQWTQYNEYNQADK